ncbi:YibE/F family protein [Halobacillus sp. ACCC02827]|uniref:YibE/F family protein n=1 Tax=Halobacillus sp. ACCC02827 TaxID=3052090 RepID=UPI0025704A82|nr:YibE/F family protein [Halobacillus sp. ACCC02827]WJE15712.1 YibE/F family protein [Halobacillus sp. ACCC02827]
MNVLVALTAILFLLMVLVGGKKGVRSFASLFFNFVILIVALFFMLDPHINPIIVTIIACAVISYVNLIYVNDWNLKTGTAFLATMVTIAILLVGIHLITDMSMIQGFSEEDSDSLAPYSLYIGLDFVKIAASVIIIGTIGAITEVAISITSSMSEVQHHHPEISRKDLFVSGMNVGRDILGTDTNTLFFAFFGGYLALLIWFKDLDYSLGEIVNSKVFSEEMIAIFCAGIGIALIIPVTAAIHSFFAVRRKAMAAE